MFANFETAQRLLVKIQDAEDGEAEKVYFEIKGLLMQSRDDRDMARVALQDREEELRRLEVLVLQAAEIRLQKIRNELSSQDR